MVDMPEAPLLKQVVVDTYERQAVIGAVCHGPVALLTRSCVTARIWSRAST
jgi:putative intracellular protease/amidase